MATIPTEQYQEIRDKPTCAVILKELEERKALLQVNPEIVEELTRYLQVQKLLPEILSADNRDDVSKAQEALHELQGRLDRVAEVHLSARKRIRSLNRLEIVAKSALLSNGVITDRTSKQSADHLVALYLPELAQHQNDWDFLEKLCRDVQDHIGNAKEALTLQMKLDGNHHWAQRSGA